MKAPRFRECAIDELLRDAVAFEVEKPDRLADVAQLRGDGLAATRLARSNMASMSSVGISSSKSG